MAAIKQWAAAQSGGSMQVGEWYIQSFSDKDIYFHVESVQKNGGMSGTQIEIDHTRPRANPKSKKTSVPVSFQRLWSKSGPPSHEGPEKF